MTHIADQFRTLDEMEKAIRVIRDATGEMIKGLSAPERLFADAVRRRLGEPR